MAITTIPITPSEGKAGFSESLPFAPFVLPGSRVVHGNVFPLGLNLPTDAPTPSVEAGAAYLSSLAQSGELTELLRKHGAVLFRGFGHASAGTFSTLVRAAEEGRGSAPFEQIGLAGKRNNLAKEVFTANEGPMERRFYQHNEYSRYTHFPSNIHFYCHVAAKKGGETPLAHSVEAFARIQAALPEFIEELATRGLSMRQVYRAPGNEGSVNQFNWEGPDAFGQEIVAGDGPEVKREKAEKQARRLTNDFRWLDDGSLEIVQHVPAFRRYKSSGRPTWFNGLAGRHGTTRDIGALEPPHLGRDGMTYLPSVYDDGTPIPRKYLDKVLEIFAELEVELKWEDGDLILLDNYQVSHGRCPWTEGERKILVSMWETGEATSSLANKRLRRVTPAFKLSSILCSASTPAFGAEGVHLVDHHLISASLSLAHSFAPHHLLRLQRPGTQPYQSTDGSPSKRSKKRRKLDPELLTPADFEAKREEEGRRSTADTESAQHHERIAADLSAAIAAVTTAWRERELESWNGEVEKVVQWIDSKEVQVDEVEWVRLLEDATNSNESSRQADDSTLDVSPGQPVSDVGALFHRLVFNSSNRSTQLHCSLPPPSPVTAESSIVPSSLECPKSVTIILPPSSAFLISSFDSLSSSNLATFGAKHGAWDVLLLDPPWPNKSVRRSGAYETFDPYDLFKVDLKEIMGPSTPCLIAVWVTNKVKFRRFIIDKLFPSWGVDSTTIAEWYWVKVTERDDKSVGGEPIWNIDSPDRRCYEGLILGYYNPTSLPTPTIPKFKAFLSTPLGHSRKPVILDLLRPYLRALNRAPNVLEVFARTALAGPEKEGCETRGVWLAIGNEAIKFNTVQSSSEGSARGHLSPANLDDDFDKT